MKYSVTFRRVILTHVDMGPPQKRGESLPEDMEVEADSPEHARRIVEERAPAGREYKVLATRATPIG